MTRRFFDRTTNMTSPSGPWHIPATVLAAYTAEDISEADAWSTEAHLARCGRCRADLAALVAGSGLQSDVVATRAAVIARVGERQRTPVTTRVPASAPAPAPAPASAPAPAPAPASAPASTGSARPASAEPIAAVSRWVRPALVLRGPWLTAVLVAVLVAAAAELVTGHATGVFGRVSTVGLLGPLAPLAGVGLCYRATDRGWAEAVLATPSAGLRLVLWRVLAVLAIAIPITAIVAAFDHRAAPVAWLLPALALAAASLALGTRIELGRAAGIVAGVWIAVAIAPAVLMRRLPIEVFSGVAQGVWAAALAACLAIMALRRAEFGRLPAWRPSAAGQLR